MENFWIIAIGVFVLVTLVVWRLTRKYFKKEIGANAWKNWSTQTYYWQSAIYLSTGVTALLLFILKWTEVL